MRSGVRSRPPLCAFTVNERSWRDHKSYLEVLELASSLDEDEYGNSRYKFECANVQVVLNHNWLDGDTELAMFISPQDEPVLRMNLVDCEDIVAIDDKRGKYIEFFGQIRNDEHLRGTIRKCFGFRLRLEPFVNVEPFYSESQADDRT